MFLKSLQTVNKVKCRTEGQTGRQVDKGDFLGPPVGQVFKKSNLEQSATLLER